MKQRMTKLLALVAAVLLLAEGLAVAAPKIEAADGAIVAPPEESGQSPYEMLLERDGFLNGINYLWIDDGHTFADNQIYGFTENTFTDGDGEAIVYNDMYNIKALGYNSIHIMLCGGRMEGVIFDENGHILGLSEEYKRNFRRFLEILDETDTYFAAFLQFHTTKIYSELGKEAWDRATQYYGNEEVRQEYITHVMRPMLEIVSEFKHRLLFLAMGDELENEINDVDVDWNYEKDRAVYGVSFEDMYGYYSDMIDLCKEVIPEAKRTIGTNWDDLWQYGELDLDAMGRNVYSRFGDDFQHIDDERYKTGLPMYFPEWGINCWTYDMDYPTFMERNILMLNEIKARGYFGAFFWRYEHTRKSDAELTMYNSFWEYPSDYNEMATTFAYEAIDDENERLGIESKLDTPRMFAYHGDGLVTWLTARQGDTFDLERSLDGGATWEKILTGAKKSDYLAPRNASIGYYQDDTVEVDAEALYRVRAYGADTSALSDESKQIVHRKDLGDGSLPEGTDEPVVKVDPAKNLLKNGGFEEGMENWATGSNLTYELLTGGQGHESDAALMISDRTNRWGRIQQDVTLEPGKIYRITFSYRDLTLRGTANVSVQFSADGNYTTDSPSFSQDFESEDTAWHTVDVTFASNNYTHGRLRFMPSSGAGIEFLIDNLHLELVGEDTNLLQNGYFADGKDGWDTAAWDSRAFCEIKDGIGPDGSAAAEFGGVKSWGCELSTKPIPVTPGVDYVLEFDMYREKGYLGGVFVKGGNDSGNVATNISEMWPSGERGTWKHLTLRFNAGTYSYVRIAFANAVDGETYRVDNVSLVKETENPVRYSVTSYNPASLAAMNAGDNLITDPGFENGNGQWKDMVDGTTVKVVSDGNAKSGDKHLEFYGKDLTEPTTAVFYATVSPNQEYLFSAWIRSKGLGADNDGDITIGIIDPETGYYLVGDPIAPDDGCKLDFSVTRSLVPTAFDDAWHLRGMTFNTEGMNRVGIMIRGKNARLLVDDMTLCLTSRSTKYVSEVNAHSITTKMYWEDMHCLPEDNLLPNPHLEGEDLSFWSAPHGYGTYVDIIENPTGFGTSLHYNGGDNPLGNTYIRWVDVQPNTKYVMSFSLKVARDGEGYFGLIDGKTAHPVIFDRVFFDSSLFGEDAEWVTMAFSFDTGTHSRIGMVIGDLGGEAYIDNLRLFEKDKATTLQDLYAYTVKATANVGYGKEAGVTARADGDGLKYAWYYKDKGASEFALTTSMTGKTYAVKMNDARDGRQVYCVITDKYGVSHTTEITTLSMKPTALKITTQPKTAYAKQGTTAKVTVKAKGDGLKYTWYVKNSGAGKYSKSSVTSSTYSVKMSSTTNNRRVYCVITDAYGKKVQTNTVLLRRQATITKESATVTYAKYKAKATVKVTAVGDGLKYAWYVKNSGASKYSKSSVTKSTYSVTMTDSVKGRRVYCKVTDKYGKTVQSKTFTLRMAASITTQPKTVTVKKNATAKVTVKAKGDGLKYTWYIKNEGAKKYSKSSVTKSTYSVKMTSKVKNRLVYVVVKDQYGNTVKSSTVRLKMK